MGSDKHKNLPRVNTGILGGTGLYEMEGVRNIQEISLETPFGKPSDPFIIGMLEGKKVVFLSRHGKGHRLLPSEINYRANIFGFKMLGVKRVISVNSVGSLKEKIKPKDIVLSDQFIDRTRRKNTFFGEGIAAHISFAYPVCPELSEILYTAVRGLGLSGHLKGTYVCIEGPSFSTKAESHLYRSWGCDVIGMTGATEAKLCREAEMCYATMNLATDYDAWHEKEGPVTVEMILKNLRQNIHNAKTVIKNAVASLPDPESLTCGCSRALENCIVTDADLIPPGKKEELRLLIQKYIKI